MRTHVAAVVCLLASLCFGSEQTAPQTPAPAADYDRLTQSLDYQGAKLQALITKPKDSARHPAVLIIGGLGCYSLARLAVDEPYAQLIIGLTHRGYVTMRVDKNGEGESGGPPCDSPQSDLKYAVGRSLAGLQALANAPYVDRDRIFILAHSIGPLEGVLVAQQFKPRGFIAAETIGRTWFEYQLEIARNQTLIMGHAYDAADRTVRLFAKCQYRLLIEKQTPEQIVKDAPDCKDAINTFGVAYTYLQQIADLNLAEEWKKVDVPVLVTWGTSDPATNADESNYLVNMINSFHPGRATYVELPRMGHALDMAPSPRAWLERIRTGEHGEFDRQFLERIDDWMKNLRKI